jgi:hypothetical protein
MVLRASPRGRRNPLAAGIPEAEILAYVFARVAEFNDLYHNVLPPGEPAIWIHHETDSRKSKSGLPDLTMTSFRDRTKVRELKIDGGIILPIQHIVISRMHASGLDAGYWTATDMADGTIARELAEMCRPAKRGNHR